MRKMLIVLMVIAGLALAGQSFATSYYWYSDNGAYNATDRVDKLPAKYRNVIRHDTDHYVSPAGIGFDRDDKGNFHFFDHMSPAKKMATREAPPRLEGPPGSEVTPQQLAEIKRRYMEWGQEPRPEINSGKVRRIISGDTFELESGEKVTYVGIEFPYELKGDVPIHNEVIEYQKKIMLGKTVHLIYGPQRYDEMGRLCAFVFIGKDLFVNADLVMNGYARVHTVPPNTEYKALFKRLETFAKKSMLGIWDAGGY